MRYYIRDDKDADVSGPFTVQELSARITAGTIASDALASSDIGDSPARLRVWRGCDWFSIADIPDLRSLVPAKPQPPPKPRRVTPVLIGMYCLGLLGGLYGAFAEQGWLMWLFVLMMLWGTLDSTRCYLRQRRQNRRMT